uniref:Amino acid transporter transmembrane domain-containing protein n=2 Tax=Rhodosorus marinus TaxID=101924 RepID=A0A7S3E9H7_9RHOD|mmetsp:Transcript_19445/g.77614  ORF Transcript_19445/g.77614 Transcript_19445/m.77614 type:complete len:409 (+) Transcript_19445:104-1330(+)
MTETSHGRVDDIRVERLAGMANVVKLILGSGSFALPWAFAQAGYVGGGIGVSVVALVATATVWMLVVSKRILSTEFNMNYAEVAGELLGQKWSVTVRAATFLSCFGACAGYLTFIGGLFSEIFDIGTTHVILMILPCFIFLSWVRTWKHLAFWSVFGNACFFLAMAAVAVDASTIWLERGMKPSPSFVPFNSHTFPLFWGPAVFLFCIHYVALPIEREMQHPGEFTSTVIPASFCFCALINIIFGLGCYAAYGSSIKDNVLRNVGSSYLFVITAIGLSVDLAITFTLMLAPAREYVEIAILGDNPRVTKKNVLTKNLIRSVLVMIISSVAIAVPNFALLIGLAGGVTDTLQTFIIPPLLYVKALERTAKPANLAVANAAAYAVAALGSVFMIWTLQSFFWKLWTGDLS